MDLAARAAEMKRLLPKLDQQLRAAATAATRRAVDKAEEMTPPTDANYTGVHTRGGEMKQHWVTDSQLTPKKVGDTYQTALANDKEYASYVNDGHRMDRHFVPGLYVNPATGMLEVNPDGTGGLVVGTQTSYVPGLHMEEAAHEEYHRAVAAEAVNLRRLLE